MSRLAGLTPRLEATQHVGDLGTSSSLECASLEQDPGSRAVGVAIQAKQQVLGADVVVAELQRLREGITQGALAVVTEVRCRCRGVGVVGREVARRLTCPVMAVVRAQRLA